VIRPLIESRGFKIGENYYLAYSPEREDPGNPNYHTKIIPKIVGGTTNHCLELAHKAYDLVIEKVVDVSSTQAAELTKILENVHRAVNIALVNEMKMVCDKMDIDIHEVIRAAATKPFGFAAYYPGPGVGGHCIPIDPFYLTWKARAFGAVTRFIELAGEINSSMPAFVVEKTSEGLNLQKKCLNGSRILVLGVAYKKNVDDFRESPPIKIMNLLHQKGAVVHYCDPHVPEIETTHENVLALKSVEFSPSTIASYDCVLIATNHDAFNYKVLAETAKLIVDSRGVYPKGLKNVVSA